MVVVVLPPPFRHPRRLCTFSNAFTQRAFATCQKDRRLSVADARDTTGSRCRIASARETVESLALEEGRSSAGWRAYKSGLAVDVDESFNESAERNNGSRFEELLPFVIIEGNVVARFVNFYSSISPSFRAFRELPRGLRYRAGIRDIKHTIVCLFVVK